MFSSGMIRTRIGAAVEAAAKANRSNTLARARLVVKQIIGMSSVFDFPAGSIWVATSQRCWRLVSQVRGRDLRSPYFRRHRCWGPAREYHYLFSSELLPVRRWSQCWQYMMTHCAFRYGSCDGEGDVLHVPLGCQPRLVAHTAYGASQKLQVPPALRRRLATASLFTSGRVA